MPKRPQLLTTMVCYINGASNLYFNLGGDYSGAAQRHPGVVQAARSFILNAGQYLEDAEKATQFDLPRGRTHFVYLLTKGGIYKLAYEPAGVPKGDKRRVLMAMYQRVVNELRNAPLPWATISAPSATGRPCRISIAAYTAWWICTLLPCGRIR